MKLNSHNEWDTLKEIIVGSPDVRGTLKFDYNKSDSEIQRAKELVDKSFPDWLRDSIKSDLDGLCDVLKDHNVKVYRPNTDRIHNIFKTPYFGGSTEGPYNARDLYMIVGDKIIGSASQERQRYFEDQAYYDIFYQYFKEGCQWIHPPKPKLDGEYLIPFYEDDGEKQFLSLAEKEIMFESANTVRMGRDLLYLVSRSGNDLGAKWLQSVLGNDYRVHTTEKIYRSSHIDSTVMCLNNNTVLLNAYRVNEMNCPEILKNWNKIYFNDIIPYPQDVLNFHRETRVKIYNELRLMGFDSSLNSIASPWIGMNFLSIDPKTIIIDKIQTKLIDVLEKNGFDCIPISFRYSYYVGGIHCSTLDTVRESKLE
jgi:N-dimethylarginine dimethylaminohydrolase